MPRNWSGLFALLICAAIATSACGGDDNRVVVTASEANFVPVIESSDVYVGVPRLILTLVERDGQPEFSDQAAFLARYFSPTEGGVRFHSEEMLDTIVVEGLRYLIADQPPLELAGQWALSITVELANGRSESSPRLPFIVSESASGFVSGDAVPRVDTPTIADGLMERLAPQSVEASELYERSTAELLRAGEPFLIVWASAGRCAGRLVCARALSQALDLHESGNIRVIAVEPFGRPRVGALQALIDAANEAWRIEAEPQFFVVDGEGQVSARFEIVVADGELRSAVDAVR